MVKQMLDENKDHDIMSIGTICKNIEKTMYKAIEINVHRSISLLLRKKLPMKALVLAGELASENSLLVNMIGRLCKKYSIPLIEEAGEDPSVMIGRMVLRMLFEGYPLKTVSSHTQILG
eukprot:TRINITY_DN10865_c0_g2_i2.p3 TRINITY_DN10865_c0_g2~~TRINITY_DN10865_c0_g2_i2.p3  ORF type:complete len:119 (+),score=16.53 TRINITY_DN10865_c0_g2_i2:870-1226(+)